MWNRKLIKKINLLFVLTKKYHPDQSKPDFKKVVNIGKKRNRKQGGQQKKGKNVEKNFKNGETA